MKARELNKIIDEIWNENPNTFRSKKEIKIYIDSLLRSIQKAIKNRESIEISSLGRMVLTVKGLYARKQATKVAKRKYNAHIKKAITKTRTKFIDDILLE